jgi:hypothetical protein
MEHTARVKRKTGEYHSRGCSGVSDSCEPSGAPLRGKFVSASMMPAKCS